MLLEHQFLRGSGGFRKTSILQWIRQFFEDSRSNFIENRSNTAVFSNEFCTLLEHQFFAGSGRYREASVFTIDLSTFG